MIIGTIAPIPEDYYTLDRIVYVAVESFYPKDELDVTSYDIVSAMADAEFVLA